jgi:hypothetical protein
MVSDNPMFLYVGEYESVEDAKADLETLKELHREKFVGTYDAAVLTKNEEGKVEVVDKTEKPTQHGGWAGCRRSDRYDLPAFRVGKWAGGGWGWRAHRPPRGRHVAL